MFTIPSVFFSILSSVIIVKLLQQLVDSHGTCSLFAGKSFHQRDRLLGVQCRMSSDRSAWVCIQFSQKTLWTGVKPVCIIHYQAFKQLTERASQAKVQTPHNVTTKPPEVNNEIDKTAH